MDVLKIIGREKQLFVEDLETYNHQLSQIVSGASFLILGAAGSIGQAVTKEIFKRNPRKLHVVDLSENNLVELVRDIRSSLGYIQGEFKTFAIDIGSDIYDAFIEHDGKYDFVLNLSALKHVRSEKDPFSLMRMIDVNIINTVKTIEHSVENGSHKYFCVSTDKAANPANMMGASKRIMEYFLLDKSSEISISTSRFANVAFSDGSLLFGFNNRIKKNQPIAAPTGVMRYFVTEKEAGLLCLFSCLLGQNKDIFFPKLNHGQMQSFSSIATRFLELKGFEPYLCASEDEARGLMSDLPGHGKWPCLFNRTDTTGEKQFEEFYMEHENVNLCLFNEIGVVTHDKAQKEQKLDTFISKINSLKQKKSWTKSSLISIFKDILPEFDHVELGKSLDAKL